MNLEKLNKQLIKLNIISEPETAQEIVDNCEEVYNEMPNL
jgi:hypothetical protein